MFEGVFPKVFCLFEEIKKMKPSHLIVSMYAIFTFIGLQFIVHAGKYISFIEPMDMFTVDLSECQLKLDMSFF